MHISDKQMVRLAIKEYCDLLPDFERKELKDQLKYDLKFYDEFALKMFNLAQLLSVFTHENMIADESISNKIINDFINQGTIDNIYIINMYKFYFKNMEDSLFDQYGQEQGGIIIAKFRSVIEKTLLNSEISEELPTNKEKVITSKI